MDILHRAGIPFGFDIIVDAKGTRENEQYAACKVGECAVDRKTDANAKAEADRRSPVNTLEGAAYTLDISHGVFDHIVPVEHAIWAFNKVAAPKDRFTAAEIKAIKSIIKTKKTPAGFPEVSEKFGSAKIYVRRVSGNVRINIIHAGHSIMPGIGIQWLLKQQKGKPADFSDIKSKEKSSALGR